MDDPSAGSRDGAPDRGAGRPFLAVERSTLGEALGERVPGAYLRFSKSLRGFADVEGPPLVEFDDGVRERFDVVVGADGLGSAVRAAVGGREPETLGTATRRLRVDLPPDAVPDADVLEHHRADGGVVSAVRTGEGTLHLRQTAPSGTDPEPARRALATLPGVGDAPPEAAVTPAGRSTDRRLRTEGPTRGRVVLLGRAARAVPLPVTLGATLALLDARRLAEALGAAAGPDRALDAYDGRFREGLAGLARRAGVESGVAALTGAGDTGTKAGAGGPTLEARLALLRAAFAGRVPPARTDGG